MADISQHQWKCVTDDHLTLTPEKIQQKQFQGKTSEQCCSTHSISLDSQKNTALSHTEFPLGMESLQFFLGNQFLQGKEKSTLPDIGNMPFFPGNQFLQGKMKFTLGTDQQPFVDTDQKSFTNSCLPFKDTHKKGGMTAMTMTAMIGITLIAILRTVNMITTHILMSVQPQDSLVFPTS